MNEIKDENETVSKIKADVKDVVITTAVVMITVASVAAISETIQFSAKKLVRKFREKKED